MMFNDVRHNNDIIEYPIFLSLVKLMGFVSNK